MFIDEAKIRVKAGDGGNGCMAFRREKFVPRGGPSGGDGGRGGDIWMESSERHNTLVHFRFNPEYKAERGRHGEGAKKTGRDGEGIVLKVPVGTIVYDEDTGEKVYDFSRADERVVIARGGRGGRGNAQFATSTHQAPREHEEGRPGEERNFRLELKLLADVGLVGYPNVGKSTLISVISAARPKVADYPFTTLEPNLGVVVVGDSSDVETRLASSPRAKKTRQAASLPSFRNEVSFVVADIPGLIEGAHRGSGLGTQFLRHIERTRLLVHMVDVSDSSGRDDVVKDVEVIVGELASFGAGLEKKPTLMVASKIDVANPEKLKKLKQWATRKKLKLYPISAVTGEGIEKLKFAMAEGVEKVRKALTGVLAEETKIPRAGD
ncbi:MAG: Obg family GTPase CgtA [Terriglobales bacterium]